MNFYKLSFKISNRKRIFKRRIKAIYYSYRLLQHCENYYDQSGGSKRKKTNIMIDDLENVLKKINGKNSYIVNDLLDKKRMVEVFKKEQGEETLIIFGEIIFDDDKSFRLHSSSDVFDKDTYYYKTKL